MILCLLIDNSSSNNYHKTILPYRTRESSVENKENKIDKVKITVEINKDLYQIIRLMSVTENKTIRSLINEALYSHYILKAQKTR